MNKNDLCDPDRIHLFLDQKLSDAEQFAFESHLTECGNCRQRLETAAASEDISFEICESLRNDQLPLPYSPLPPGEGGAPAQWVGVRAAADSALDSTGEETFSSQATVLKLLAPTDDDRMLGRWGTYEVVGVVGTGGMGVVLKAFDTALNRYVAIKILAPHLGSSGAARKRFSREAQASAAVVHDNVIEIYGVAEAAGLPYLVMPYVRGPSLQRRLDDEGPLALVEILRVGMQAAAGLAAAHAQGLVHRDVKPANILLADGIERVKLTDFGLARAADDASLTKTGIIAGTPQYMSPEQARGEPVDQRSDLFSLGSVHYAMCTGRPPFRAETSYGVLRRITDEEPRPIREINPDIPEWLCGIVEKLMAKGPDDRFQSARDVASLLEQCLAHVQQPTAVPLPAYSPLPPGEGQGVRAADSALPGEVHRVSAMDSPRLSRDGQRVRPIDSPLPPGEGQGVRAAPRSLKLRNRLLLGTLAMLTLIGISLFTISVATSDSPNISGNWQGDDWGHVTLAQTAPGEYTGTYTDTVVKEKGPGKIELKWSRIERRFNGTWREGEDDRFGDLSIHLVRNEIRGGLTTSGKSKINPGTPRLAELVWTRAGAGSKEQGTGSRSTTPAAAISITKTPGRPWTADWPGEVTVHLEDVGGDGRYWRPDGTPTEGSPDEEFVGHGMVAKTGKDEVSRTFLVRVYNHKAEPCGLYYEVTPRTGLGGSTTLGLRALPNKPTPLGFVAFMKPGELKATVRIGVSGGAWEDVAWKKLDEKGNVESASPDNEVVKLIGGIEAQDVQLTADNSSGVPKKAVEVILHRHQSHVPTEDIRMLGFRRDGQVVEAELDLHRPKSDKNDSMALDSHGRLS